MRVFRRRAHGEQGFSLPELLVTISLMAIVGTMVAMFASNFSRTFTEERARMDSTNVAATGMNEVVRIIRAGMQVKDETVTGGLQPVFVYAGAERLTMRAAVDTTSGLLRPIQVTFVLDSARVLTETRVTPRAGNAGGSGGPEWIFTGPGTTTATRPIARKILPQAGSEPFLFTYYDEDGNVLTPLSGASLSSADMIRISSVEVYLKVQADPTGRAEPVVLLNRTGIPNVD